MNYVSFFARLSPFHAPDQLLVRACVELFGTELWPMEYARTPEELDALVDANPHQYPSEFIEKGSFAYDLMKNNSFMELTALLEMPPDPDLLKQWCLTEDQWTEQLTLAWLAFMHEHSL